MSSATSTCGLEAVPLHAPLSAKYKTTFAYPTIKDRCPTILCRVIDHLYRERQHIGRDLGEEAQEGLKKVVEKLSQLRYEMQTDKPISSLEDDIGNKHVWNEYLDMRKIEEGGVCSWYKSAWMWVECYMYRRVFSALHQVPQLRGFDYFQSQKQEGFMGSLAPMQLLADWLLVNCSFNDNQESNLEKIFRQLLQVSLWGNKCDLSISAGVTQKAVNGNPVDGVERLKENLLVDQGGDIWNRLTGGGGGGALVDIVMDNAGFELFTDLCLADFLVTSKLATKVRMRIKDQPWFVSDTTRQDFSWTLNKLTSLSDSPSLVTVGNRWKGFVDSGTWEIFDDAFWTYPHVFSEMATADPELYSELSQADLVIFKGDLNYRKLVGDVNWETTVPFSTALQGFLPSNIASLRTLKADVVTGLEPGKAEETFKKDPDWMTGGNWGVIQFATKN